MLRFLCLVSPILAATASVGPSAEMKLSLLPSSTPASKGGRCLDGSMAGYYLRQGSKAGRFVIYLQGGGACYDEHSCTSRAKGDLGSSKKWPGQLSGSQFLSTDCSANPGFCNATGVYIKYCTGDAHSGNHTAPTPASWGLIFDGHANFAAILDDLESAHGLGAATDVLLTGGSAGGIGTFANADFLADRLPQAMVKAAPDAGWFFPAALPADLPDVYAPSDWSHFAAGTHGNQNSENNSLPAFIAGELWGSRGLLPASCVADQKPGQWWACSSIHKLYKYIKTPLFVIENQYDSNQIFAQEQAPTSPGSAAEYATLERYVIMYGEAMRNSTAQVLSDAPLHKAPGTDGIFHPSCLKHGVEGEMLQGQTHEPIVADWFFEQGALKQYYRMVEAPSGTGLPVNPGKGCAIPSGPGPSTPTPVPAPGGCAAQLKKDGCLDAAAAAGGLDKCEKCAEAHDADLKAAGCTYKEVKELCGN
jgi:ribosome maturation protein SDO1